MLRKDTSEGQGRLLSWQAGHLLKPAATCIEKQATAGSEQAYHSLFQREKRKLRQLQQGGRKDNA